MAEYIERQTVVDMLQNLSYDDWNQGASTTWANAFSECAEMIRDIPTADVRPVERGKWKPFDLTYGRSIYACTSCGESSEVPVVMDKPTYRYCPNCGAEMRGERDG